MLNLLDHHATVYCHVSDRYNIACLYLHFNACAHVLACTYSFVYQYTLQNCLAACNGKHCSGFGLHMNEYYCNYYAKQKHLGCKKVRGQSEATLLTGMCDQKL